MTSSAAISDNGSYPFRSLEELRHYLRPEFESARLVLFTGAGFSVHARAQDGNPVPSGPELADDLWNLCFADEERDGSGLQDLFHHALSRHTRSLGELLRRRLCVSDETLPEFYRLWFSMPWRRAYTLNVDDIELVASRRFVMPRRIEVISALTDAGRARHAKPSPDYLEFVHLNGLVEDGPEHVTFATMQYGERLASRDPWYTQLVADLMGLPFVFVGTRLDESPLWQHVELGRERARVSANERPLSFLVSPQLERARRTLLSDLRIEWICMSTEQFATDVLAHLTDTIPLGLEALHRSV